MGGDLYDANIIVAIYNKCLVFEAEWRKKVMGGKPKEVEEGNAEIEESGLPTEASP